MTNQPTTMKGARHLRRGPCALLLGLLLCVGVQAQMGPGGGGGGPPGGMGGMGPGKGTPPAAEAQRMPTLDDLVPPDPWRIWHERLHQAEPRLALSEVQQTAFRAFLRELDEAVRLNGQRVQRSLRRVPASVSATVDVARDLRQEADDARDWQAALDDLGARWAALAKLFKPAQQAEVDTLYRASRELAQQWQKDRPRPPAR